MTILIINDRKGITLVECMIAVFLTVVLVIALMSMQPLSIQTAARSDYLGRAVGIMQAELEAREYAFMHNDLLVNAGTAYVLPNPLPINQVILSGNINYTVVTTISQAGTNTKLINVRVTWPGNVAGITSSMIVTRQIGF